MRELVARAQDIQAGIEQIRPAYALYIEHQRALALCHQQISEINLSTIKQRNGGTIPSLPIRLPFSKDDDLVLQHLVDIYGCSQWDRIAVIMHRSQRQCRERWNSYLSKQLEPRPWTPEDEQKVLSLMSELGPRWTQIGAQLSRRGIDVKNHYNSSMKNASTRPAPPVRAVQPPPITLPMIRSVGSVQAAPNLSAVHLNHEPAIVDIGANPGNNKAVEVDIFDPTPDKDTPGLYEDFPGVDRDQSALGWRAF
ncbi:MAG: hypothetical protein LBR89_00885 [Holosporales bacterium]|nr:hypothetical protein [Holosporales bacterium]